MLRRATHSLKSNTQHAPTHSLLRPLSLPHSKNIARFSLANGVDVYAYENFSSPAVVVSGYLIAGALDEPCDPCASKTGWASFVADCLTRGTHRYTYEQIYETIESVGATLSVYGGMFTTSFFAKSLVQDLPLIFELLSEVVRYPIFPEAEVEKERAEWLTDLHERANDTRAMCSLAFNALCYPDGHPYHYSTEGYLRLRRRSHSTMCVGSTKRSTRRPAWSSRLSAL